VRIVDDRHRVLATKNGKIGTGPMTPSRRVPALSCLPTAPGALRNRGLDARGAGDHGATGSLPGPAASHPRRSSGVDFGNFPSVSVQGKLALRCQTRLSSRNSVAWSDSRCGRPG
jgi:hypothetical protein